jgi:hypothetical protein
MKMHSPSYKIKLNNNVTHNYRQKDTCINVCRLAVCTKGNISGWNLHLMMFIFQAVIKRLEKECDMARGNIEHLEEERDTLRDRLKVLRDYLL